MQYKHTHVPLRCDHRIRFISHFFLNFNYSPPNERWERRGNSGTWQMCNAVQRYNIQNVHHQQRVMPKRGREKELRKNEATKENNSGGEMWNEAQHQLQASNSGGSRRALRRHRRRRHRRRGQLCLSCSAIKFKICYFRFLNSHRMHILRFAERSGRVQEKPLARAAAATLQLHTDLLATQLSILFSIFFLLKFSFRFVPFANSRNSAVWWHFVAAIHVTSYHRPSA